MSHHRVGEPAIVTLATPAELAEAELVHRAIHGEAEDWDGLLRLNPVWSAPGAHRAVRQDGRLVSLTSLATTDQRFGGTKLKVGEIGLVGTLPEYRRQGLSRALMESWLTRMRAEGYALTYLFGIPNYYERWGYHYAAPDHVYPYLTVEQRMLDPFQKADAGTSGARVRPLDIRRDLPAVMALADDDHAALTCSPVRSAATWRYLVGRADRHGVDWLGVEEAEAGDALIGYARVKRWAKGMSAHPPGAVTDVAVTSERACRALAAHLAGHLRSGDGERLPLCVAPHGRFGAWLFRHGARRGCDNRIYPGSWAAMYRVVDLPAVLDAWRDDWRARLAAAAPLPLIALTVRAHADDDGVATIELDRADIRIHPGAGGTEVGAAPEVVVPWLTGWRGAAEWLDAARPVLSADEQRCLTLLFPERHPWIGDTYQG